MGMSTVSAGMAVVLLAGSSVSALAAPSFFQVNSGPAPFGPPGASLRVLNERPGAPLEHTHTVALSVLNLVHNPGSVMGDGSVRPSVSSTDISRLGLFDALANIPGGTTMHTLELGFAASLPDAEPIGLLLPAVQKVREAAARLQTSALLANGLFQNFDAEIEVLVPGAVIDDPVGFLAGDGSVRVRLNIALPRPPVGGLDNLFIVRLTGEESAVPGPGAALTAALGGLLASRRRRSVST